MLTADKRDKSALIVCLSALLGATLSGCASIGSPGGGLYDEAPPVLRSSDPKDGGTNVSKQKISLHFNENVKLNNVMDKLTVSPPQEKSAVVQSNAKNVTIELQDSLRPNTTYSIDLADAVQDNNEGNPMEGLSLLFSTGDHIDSMQIAGFLLNAEDLEPITGAYVGIYRLFEPDGSACIKDSVTAESLGDSLFMRYPFERAGKTDAYGAFKILGCAPGTYKLFALTDGNGNYKYDLTSENIAFVDTLIVPSMENRQKADTVWADSQVATARDSSALGTTERTIDTIRYSGYIDYKPTGLVLLSFNEGKKNRYLDDCSRPDSIHINVRFAAGMDSLPKLTFLTPDSLRVEGDSVLICEPNATLDTLSYWIKDSVLYCADTLLLEMTYLHTDTSGLDVPCTDTISLLKPIVRTQTNAKQDEPKKGKGRRRRKNDKADEDSVPKVVITYMELKQVYGQTLDIGKKPRFEVSAPLAECDTRNLHLQRQQDSLWIDMPLQWVPDTIHPRRFTLLADPHFNPATAYRLTADSAAMKDIYGQPLNSTTIEFKERSIDDYGHILFYIQGVTDEAFVQLLSTKDQPIQQAKVQNGQAKFVHVPTGSYFARLVVDSNRNGKFDTGNLQLHQQPEQVYYLNLKLEIRATWNYTQTWDVTATELTKQKPEEVKINKPKEKKEKVSKNEEYLRKLGKI